MYTRERSMRERKKTPSFSSSLLDAIYSSIDDEDSDTCRPSQLRKQHSISFEERHVSSIGRGFTIEKWTEKQRIEKIPNSGSISSDSSSGAFSSSETESAKNYRATSSCFTPIRTKPFRTRVATLLDEKQSDDRHHPVTPGRRIVSFLNSFFSVKKEKKNRKPKPETLEVKKSKPATPCDQKTPSAFGKSSHVRSGNIRTCDQKSAKKSVDQARDILRELEEIKKRNYGLEGRMVVISDNDDDVDSCASSDLFEIEDLVGIGTYTEELPVYETTNLKINQAIAHGFIL